MSLVSIIGLRSYLPETEASSQPEYIVTTSGDTTQLLKPAPQYPKEAMLVTQLLQYRHYKKIPIEDSLSSVIFDDYIASFDNNRVYFLKSDIDSFNKYRFELDDDLKDGKLDFPYEFFASFKDRFFQRMDYVDKLLGQDFNFDIDESYDTNRDNVPWAANETELNETWRKIIKSQLLSLKLSGKTIPDAKEVLTKRYQGYRKAISQYSSEDIFQQYLNSFTQSFDPHTNYFSPVSAESFMIDLNLSLEGIGARLTTDGDYTIIASVVAGGPAFKSNMIHENDKIVGVAQNDDGKYVDVIGWRVTDVVKLIRGPKGTIVRLQVIPADEPTSSPPMVVRLVRDKIKLDDEKVTSQIVPVNRDGKEYKLGVINVPSFYFDYDAYKKGEKDYNSTSRDVRKILEQYKTEGVDGVLVDLRRNGGGSLTEAIELTGLFIKDGPVVQVKARNGYVEHYDDSDKGIVWDGPLTVLTNRFSASASEIFSGAIQDYNRGLIIGEQTYGKGTVQNMVDLSNYLEDLKGKVGELKLTQAKFYRVNGGSTQLKGVTPDIGFPSAYDAEIFGEGSKPSALKWDHILPTQYTPTGMITPDIKSKLEESFQQRMKTDPDLIKLQEEIKEAKESRNNTVLSLQESKRKKEMEDIEAKRAARNKLSGAIIDPESKNMKLVKMDDTYLKEGLLILAELVSLDIG